MSVSVKYICKNCGSKTSSFTGKPPAKWTQPCSGNKKTGLHEWTKN